MNRLRAMLGFPFGRRPLAALLYALIAFPLALVGFVLTLVGLLVGGALSVTTLGLWLIAVTVRGALALGGLQRVLARGLLGMDIEEPERRPGTGPLGWRRALLADRSGWRAVACALATPFTAVFGYVGVLVGYVWGVLLTLHPVLEHWNYETRRAGDGTERRVSLEFFGFQVDSWPRWLIPVALGLLLLATAAWLLRQALAPHRSWIATLLGPDPADRRIRTLEETRAQAVDDAAATLRRIERDLHDGTQARLVGLAMHLTMIRELIGAGAPADRLLAVVDTAQGNAGQAIADLRNLVKGIHPPVLDQGLDTALATLAADSPLSVEVSADIGERPIPAVESIAYFCAAELLANATKHSGATRATVTVTARDGLLRLSVRDDGRGGAVIGAGSGLTGLLARARTVDGTLACDSPPGGPTVVTVELPC
ncbi:sensor histidine kinase [Streptomyces rhizosphaerihabitans]|uniref:sensor histidine kinase n=1 Tax=Streptomyces rhizosphaerihabitans TaxID=1266770 RepID=UPI0021C06880|nr:sensor histidine kinase [Streptomyces rhizosphaerihabitans]MCT9004163.1 sensor domain-containing protein [Streptomyces rhizosphaerihabitans]